MMETSAETEGEREVLTRHLARLATGDRDALAAVYRMTSAMLNALLIRMLRDRGAAEEVLQEVYLTVWRRGATFDPSRASPMTWLVTVARNKAIDRLRSERTRGVAAAERIEEVDVPDPGESIVESLERAEQRSQLSACLRLLDEHQRAAIRAAFYDGLTYEALAAREGVPVGTMKSWIRRGLRQLRACLDGVAA